MRTVYDPDADDITEVFYRYSEVEQPLRDFVKALLDVGFKPQVSYGDVQGDMFGIKQVFFMTIGTKAPQGARHQPAGV